MKSATKKILSVVFAAILISNFCVPMSYALDTTRRGGDALELIRSELQSNGSSIENELNKLLGIYQRMSYITEEETERVKYVELAEGVEELIEEYKAALDSSQCTVQSSGTDSVHALYVAAVISYFTGNKYYLAAELLTRAKLNTDPEYKYSPTYASVVRNTKAVRDIVKSGRSSGSGEIKFTDSPDGYYAIHLFNYEKQQGSNYLITDVYDFELGDQSYPDDIAGVAVNAMALAQKDGYLVPYTVWIS